MTLPVRTARLEGVFLSWQAMGEHHQHTFVCNILPMVTNYCLKGLLVNFKIEMKMLAGHAVIAWSRTKVKGKFVDGKQRCAKSQSNVSLLHFQVKQQGCGLKSFLTTSNSECHANAIWSITGCACRLESKCQNYIKIHGCLLITHVSFMDIPMLLNWVPVQIIFVALIETLGYRSIGIWPSLEKQQ